jgi:hypothetical protein
MIETDTYVGSPVRRALHALEEELADDPHCTTFRIRAENHDSGTTHSVYHSKQP